MIIASLSVYVMIKYKIYLTVVSHNNDYARKAQIDRTDAKNAYFYVNEKQYIRKDSP